MAIGLPGTIDFRGIVKRNADGTFDSDYPAGDKPITPPDDITDLGSASVSANSIALNWTPNGETLTLERRETGGTWAVVDSNIGGSVGSYIDSGLTPETEYEWRMLWSGNGESNTYTRTTLRDVGDSYQLQAGEFPPERMPLRWINPTGSETNRSAMLWSHSRFDYVRPVTVAGGSPPYYFYLTSPVTGVTLERKAPSWNPYLYLWADLTIDHTQFQSGSKTVELNCVDQNGSVVTQSLTITVDDSKFLVLDKGNAAVSPAGTFSDPLDDFVDVYGTDYQDATHAGKIIALKTGASQYTMDNFDTQFEAVRFNNEKPSSIIGIPGESPDINWLAALIPGNLGSATYTDYVFSNFSITGGDTTSSDVKIFANFGAQERVVYDRLKFYNIDVGTTGTDNEACIYCSNTGPGSHRWYSVVDCEYENLGRSFNGLAAIDIYSTRDLAFVGGRGVNSSSNNFIWAKARNQDCMFAGTDVYDISGQENISKIMHPNNGDGGTTDPIGLIQFIGIKAYRETDGLQDDSVLYIGDVNQTWGEIYFDRMTVVGGVRAKDGTDSQDGTAQIVGSLIFNEQSEVIPPFAGNSGNVSGNRSDVSTYLDSAGDVLETATEYGTAGANFVAPQGS